MAVGGGVVLMDPAGGRGDVGGGGGEEEEGAGMMMMMEGVMEMEQLPSYSQMLLRSLSSLSAACVECESCGFDLTQRTFFQHCYLSLTDALLFVLCAVTWTLLRKATTSCVFQPLGRWCHLHPRDAAKMPESAWKLMFYTGSWSYSTYLLFCTNYPFFHNPPSVFHDWKTGMEVPSDIAVAYLVQASFYGHAIYAACYMDTWRKDSIVMLVHHLITLVLIAFSYAFRYHNIGILVLFLHDINDIQLEFTKLNVYFKNRGGVYHRFNDVVSNIGCCSFAVSWFWFRLYWFPLKVLYASCHSSLQSVPNIPFYFFFNLLLLTLTVMNIYWFLYIILLVLKVLTGQMNEVNDVREYDIDEGQPEGEGHGEGDGQSMVPGQKHPDLHSKNSYKEGKHPRNGIVKSKRL